MVMASTSSCADGFDIEDITNVGDAEARPREESQCPGQGIKVTRGNLITECDTLDDFELEEENYLDFAKKIYILMFEVF